MYFALKEIITELLLVWNYIRPTVLLSHCTGVKCLYSYKCVFMCLMRYPVLMNCFCFNLHLLTIVKEEDLWMCKNAEKWLAGWELMWEITWRSNMMNIDIFRCGNRGRDGWKWKWRILMDVWLILIGKSGNLTPWEMSVRHKCVQGGKCQT